MAGPKGSTPMISSAAYSAIWTILGGSLEVDSAEDATTFQLVLPRYTDGAAAAPA